MRKLIHIGDAAVTFCSNAATPLYFKRIFNDDLMRHISVDEDDLTRTEVCMQLAFVLAMQAEDRSTGEMIKLGEKDYLAWLELFEYLAVVDVAQEALSCFLGLDGSEGEQDSKNAAEGQSAS